jgi:hypothetical protein
MENIVLGRVCISVATKGAKAASGILIEMMKGDWGGKSEYRGE